MREPKVSRQVAAPAGRASAARAVRTPGGGPARALQMRMGNQGATAIVQQAGRNASCAAGEPCAPAPQVQAKCDACARQDIEEQPLQAKGATAAQSVTDRGDAATMRSAAM